MKILHFSHSDVTGGAAKTAYRIHRALLGIGDDSRMLVLNRASRDPTVHRAAGARPIDRLRFQAVRAVNARIDAYLHPMFGFSSDFFGAPKVGWEGHVRWADVVHFHFVTGFLTSRQAALVARQSGAPAVWTVHDFASFTGGCHYPGDCAGWHAKCGRCPVLGSRRRWDLSRWGWRRRSRSYRRFEFHVVTYSTWAAAQVKASSLAGERPVEVIPSAVDPGLFRKLPQPVAREALGLPGDGFLVLCLAADFRDPRKGLAPLLDALGRLRERMGEAREIAGRPVRLLTVGHVDLVSEFNLPWEGLHLGFLGDDRLMALAYQAADVLVCTSRQETGPQTVVEAMMCATPVAALRSGLVADLIEHGRNGFIVEQEEPARLGDCIFALFSGGEIDGFRRAAHGAARARHAPEAVARGYHGLYERLLGPRPGTGGMRSREVGR